MYRYIVFLMILSSTTLAQSALSFQQAFEKRLTRDRGLKAFDKHQSALALNVESANALAPTEFESALENFGQDEIEIAAKQLIEAPSIRRKRVDIFNTEKVKLETETLIYQDHIHNRLSYYFLEAVQTNRELRLSKERLSILNRTYIWQRRQFEAGALSESELIRTKLEVTELTADVDRTESSLLKLARGLSVYLGMEIVVDNLPKDLPEYTPTEAIMQAWEQYDSSPSVRRQEAQLAFLRAEKQAAELPLIPSISIAVGMKIVPEFNQKFSLLGLSLESPLFSKQGTRIQAKEFEIQAGLDELEYIKSNLNLQREQWLADWRISSSQLVTLQDLLIPEASMLQEKVNHEYRAGARPYLDVLDTQNLLTDLQAKALALQIGMASRLFEMNLTLGEIIYEFN